MGDWGHGLVVRGQFRAEVRMGEAAAQYPAREENLTQRRRGRRVRTRIATQVRWSELVRRYCRDFSATRHGAPQCGRGGGRVHHREHGGHRGRPEQM
jgi:hypothetical protein